MHIQKITRLYFSPTDTTRQLLNIITNRFPVSAEDADITPYTKRDASFRFGPDELVVLGMPVYGGRIPSVAAQTLQNIRGDHTPVILVAAYGNRDYDDALLEMKDWALANGFLPCAAAALITEHNIMHSVGAGRPDHKDTEEITAFADAVWQKLCACTADDFADLSVKGNRPYKVFGGFPMKPLVSDACIRCGQCASMCPVHAIPEAAPNTTDTAACISCMRCIKICPVHARALDQDALQAKEKGFYEKCHARRDPEFIF